MNPPNGPPVAAMGVERAPSPAQHPSPTPTFHHRSPNNQTVASAPSVDERRRVADPVPTNKTRPRGSATEEWMSNPNMSPQSYDLLGGAAWGDGLPRLMDIWGGVDAPDGNAPSSPGSRAAPMGKPPASSSTSLRYPVLQPLMPFLESNLPRRLVFDLLELYFTSAFSTHMHPVCHHIHCYVLRKASFLSREHPRASSPALLASMLWVAALDDRAFSLSISPLQRKKICQFLCALTIRLLRPLIHVSFSEQGGSSTGGTAFPMNQEFSPDGAHHPPFEAGGDDRGLVGPAGSLDDVITYIHVASIISASEQKAASMRWSVLPLSLHYFAHCFQVACGLYAGSRIETEPRD